jgi:hypothetical protein
MSEGLKSLQSIPVFTGDHTLPWLQFEHRWIIAIKNRNLSEQTLRTALASKLQGVAFTYYLSLDRVETLSFSEVLSLMRKRYTQDSTTAINHVRSISQNPHEPVEDYSARLLIAAKGMMPEGPRELVVLKYSSGDQYVFPNPLKADQERAYEAQYELAKIQLTPYFLGGLRSDIRQLLTSDKYVNFDDLVSAAVKAEWMRNSSSRSAHVHNLEGSQEGSQEAEANAAFGNYRGRGRGRGRGARGGGGRGNFTPGNARGGGQGNQHQNDQKSTESKCWNCNEIDHFSRNCPYERAEQKGSNSKQNNGRFKRIPISSQDYKSYMTWKSKKGGKAKKPGASSNFLQEGGEPENDGVEYEYIELELEDDGSCEQE